MTNLEYKEKRSGHGKVHKEHREHHHKKKRSRKSCPKQFKAFMWAILTYVIYVAHMLKDWLLQTFFEWFWADRQPCPALPEDALFLRESATTLAQMIRTQKITSHRIVEAYIARMEHVNPLLNAIVDGPFMEALDVAKEIDERIKSGQVTDEEFQQKPFLGVPFTTKDSTAVHGKLQTLGLVSRKSTKAKEDAECVRLLRKAGGIPLATTNIPEVNKWQETRNMLFGQTNNPYDTRRTVGGSSGGEGAAIASCMSAFGIGTDIGGSIRMPAFFCGIFGHKPTVGIVNTRGCTMRTGKEPSTMVVAGPMSRHAEDLLPMLRVMSEPSAIKTMNLDRPVDVKKLKFYYIRQSGELRCSPVSGDLQAAMAKVVAHFGELTSETPQLVELSSIEYTSRMWRYWMTKEPADFNALLGNGKTLNGFVELAKKCVGQSEFTLAAFYSMLDSTLPQENEDRIKEYTRKCDEELTNMLGDDGILLYHSYTSTAPFHYTSLINIYNFSYWALFNVLHVPVTQVPLGLSADGLPLGIQVVATRNRDRDCLAVAAELERAFDGWRPPFQ